MIDTTTIIEAHQALKRVFGEKIYQLYAYWGEGIIDIAEHEIKSIGDFEGKPLLLTTLCDNEPHDISLDDFGKTVFATKEDAECAKARLESFISKNADILYDYFGRKKIK